MVPHVVARKAHQRLQEFSFATPKRLLQQYPAESGSRRSCRVSALTNGMLDGGHGGPPYEVERITASTGRPGQPTLSPKESRTCPSTSLPKHGRRDQRGHGRT